MKRIINSTLLYMAGLMIVVSCSARAKDESVLTKKFTDVAKIEISTVSGDCKVIKHDESFVLVKLTHKYKPSKSFLPVFEQKENVLMLREDMLGSNSGNSLWVLMVPQNMDVAFKSASGGILLSDIKGQINVNTASGNINAAGITLAGSSNFSTASGTSKVSLAKAPAYDMLINSASGTAQLNFNGTDIKGTIEMICRPSLGKILCPLKFAKESAIDKHGQEYLVKSLELGDSSPNIRIHTASGLAILKK